MSSQTNTQTNKQTDKQTNKQINKQFRYNLPDTVVWNPWDSKAKEMEDFGDDEVFDFILKNTKITDEVAPQQTQNL